MCGGDYVCQLNLVGLWQLQERVKIQYTNTKLYVTLSYVHIINKGFLL